MEGISVTLDNDIVTMLAASFTAAGFFIEAIVHWDKIRPVLTSSITVAIMKLVLIFGCYWFGEWAIIIGANIYFVIVFLDFVRDDNSPRAIGLALLSAMTGVFNFAVQFALAVNGK